ncbi:MAG TPA: hypothetical protein VFA39_05845 [Steroidobacteraceae bacterium]|nr:hypothetical protein [Steroidobacteraceae bacterium]
MKFRAWSGWRSTRLAASFVALALELSAGASALAQLAPAGASSQPAIMNREKEIALALSACPPSIAGRAAVYVLGKSGYVKVRESGNGFTAIVQHSLPGAQEPQCMDEGAAGTFLQRDLMVAELRAQGKSSEEVHRAVAAAMAKGALRSPHRPGVIYMLSPQNRIPNEKGVVVPFPPHVMFYGTSLTNADIGVDKDSLGADGNPMGPAFVAAEGSPFALVIVPVGKDGGMTHVMPTWGR